MEKVKIKLSALWVALMLTYLFGDVLRIFSGDFVAGEVEGMQITQAMYLGMAALMVIPIVMVFLSLTLKYKANRWTNIILAIFFFCFQSHRVAYIPFSLRQIPDYCRTGVQCADCLAHLEVA
jgi:predicted ferric reductase